MGKDAQADTSSEFNGTCDAGFFLIVIIVPYIVILVLDFLRLIGLGFGKFQSDKNLVRFDAFVVDDHGFASGDSWVQEKLRVRMKRKSEFHLVGNIFAEQRVGTAVGQGEMVVRREECKEGSPDEEEAE